MKLNKFRKVRYTDDGCTEYECLLCGKGAEARYMGFTYCSHCGTKWDGELKWDENASYEKKRLGHGSQPREATNPEFRGVISTWCIDTKVNLFGNSEWEKGIPLPWPAAAALRRLREERRVHAPRRAVKLKEEFLDDGDPLPGFEVRLRLVPSPRLPLP
jgi:hypothetical protein